MNTAPLVSIVDDDESIRESVPGLLQELGFASQAYSSAEEFLASGCINRSKCLILDVTMPGMSGPQLRQELIRRGYEIPIVFITGHDAENVRARLVAAGAVAVIFKPISDTALRQALNIVFGTNGTARDVP